MISGNIPTKLTLISRSAEEIENHFEGIEESINKIKVLPTFVADSVNENSIQRGMDWAGGRPWETKKYKGKKTETDNAPLTDIRIIGLEYRSEGGRAYKVLFGAKDYYADLREDVLLEAILSVGIEAGGRLNGEYLWARVGSQMKLVRIGSSLHTANLDSMQYKAKPKISIKNLEIGRIYIDSREFEHLYLGKYSIRNFHGLFHIYKFFFIF